MNMKKCRCGRDLDEFTAGASSTFPGRNYKKCPLHTTGSSHIWTWSDREIDTVYDDLKKTEEAVAGLLKHNTDLIDHVKELLAIAEIYSSKSQDSLAENKILETKVKGLEDLITQLKKDVCIMAAQKDKACQKLRACVAFIAVMFSFIAMIFMV